MVTGTSGDDWLVGGSTDDVLEGLGGDDILDGLGGDDRLDGGAGIDALRGGTGNDLYVVDSSRDRVVEASAAGGIDVVRSSASFILGRNVEDLTLTGTGAINGTGNALANILIGNAGANVLRGGAGADGMRGGAGNDVYYVDDIGDRVVESSPTGGSDRVYSTVSFVLGARVENLILKGSAAINATGNDLANTLTGNSAANVLNGRGGADTMKGGAGDDTYHVGAVGDRVIEGSAGGGLDRVYSTISYRLGRNVENLILKGEDAIDGTGNALANILTGNAAANRIDGGAGADTLQGRAGDDIYVVDDSGDRIVEISASHGVDLVLSRIGFVLPRHVENLTLTGTGAIDGTGNALANSLVGNSAANVLDGGGGADTMRGGAGDDTYIVDDAGDVVVEGSVLAGIDIVRSSVSHTLSDRVENLVLTGGGASDGTGNGLANGIVGNSADNVLDGGGGADRLTGGRGSDAFAFTASLGSGNVDTVTDFAPGDDRILLGGEAGQPFAAMASGALRSFNFATGTAATDPLHRILYDPGTGALRYDPDGVGGAGAIRFATLDPGLSLEWGDFAVSGPANRLPSVTSGASAAIEENSARSTIVYQAVASDPDGDAITYSLGGDDSSFFTIDHRTGAVRLAQAADFETRSSYSINVFAFDSSGDGGFEQVTVSVTDVDETPGEAYLVTETSASNDFVGSAQPLDRGRFVVTDDGDLPDPSLPSATITGSIAAPEDRDFFRVTLEAGELLILDVDNSGGNLDALLRVYSAGGGELALNDDLVTLDPGSDPHPEYGHNTDSFIRFRAPEDGTYFFSIESFQDPENPTSGTYELHVGIGPPATKAQLDEENIQALLGGASWSTLDLTYGFTRTADDYGPGEATEEIAAGMSPLSSLQQATVSNILGQIAAVTNLTFAEISTSPGTAQLRYALSAQPETAHAFFPGPGDGGDSWYNNLGYLDPAVGNYAWMTFIHETGHALGLKHPHEGSQMSPDRDSIEFTVMSYRSYVGAAISDASGYTNETWGFAQTLMMYDIAALQRLYGADFGHNAGDTTYGWNAATGAFLVNGVTQWTPGGNRILMTLWDGGGTDTYDLSNYSGSMTIDLRPGEWSQFSHLQVANLGDGNMARGNVANALLYNGDPRSLIENAIGGSDNNLIIANQAVNRLTGNGGQDQFRWHSVGDSPSGAADIILDFHIDDILNLSAIDAVAATPGDDAFTLIQSNAFSGTAGELRWVAAGDQIDIFGDVDGDALADLHIVANWTDGSEPWIPDQVFWL